METTSPTFTPEQWARHEKIVAMIRAAKQRKATWEEKVKAQWAEEDRIRKAAD